MRDVVSEIIEGKKSKVVEETPTSIVSDDESVAKVEVEVEEESLETRFNDLKTNYEQSIGTLLKIIPDMNDNFNNTKDAFEKQYVSLKLKVDQNATAINNINTEMLKQVESVSLTQTEMKTDVDNFKTIVENIGEIKSDINNMKKKETLNYVLIGCTFFLTVLSIILHFTGN